MFRIKLKCPRLHSRSFKTKIEHQVDNILKTFFFKSECLGQISTIWVQNAAQLWTNLDKENKTPTPSITNSTDRFYKVHCSTFL